jgi:CheY-like chemotaxis protein
MRRSPSPCAERLLEEAGYVVFTAATVSEALAFFKSHPIDLVITDHLLPNASGQDLALELRRVNPKLPVLTLSGGQIPTGIVQPPDFSLHKLEGPTEMLSGVVDNVLAQKGTADANASAVCEVSSSPAQNVKRKPNSPTNARGVVELVGLM